jgi:hypothetical protein
MEREYERAALRQEFERAVVLALYHDVRRPIDRPAANLLLSDLRPRRCDRVIRRHRGQRLPPGLEDASRLEFGVAETIHDWRQQEQIDQGDARGLTSVERAELLAARKRIRELGVELAIHRRASELIARRATQDSLN